MITKEELHSIGYNSVDNTLFNIAGEWEYEFNIKTQELWHINDGIGEPEFICKVTNFEKLKEFLEMNP